MTTLPSDIKTTLQQLCLNEQFLSNISYYTKVAYDCVFFPEEASQQHESQCPTPLLMAIVFMLANNQSVELLAGELPEGVREEFTKAVKVLDKKVAQSQEDNAVAKMKNEHFDSLVDVKWQMNVENGREVWIVELYYDNTQEPTVMKLNYEELSLLAFKINQLVSHVKSMDLNKII